MLIDTFPKFIDYWNTVQNKSVDEQIEGWANDYMSSWPELLEKQIADYAEQNLDWKEIAREKVFPYICERLPAMQEARENLVALCPTIYFKAQETLGFEETISFVIYVGIGCGAGWVTPYDTKPAILFGLENIAESGWSTVEAIKGLIAHETGHVVHFHWREENELTLGDDEWWQLYSEGFAQRCESLLNGANSWHEETTNAGWLEWCRNHKSWLANEFLMTVAAGQPVNRFFGSWHEIESKKQTGYYLGHEVVRELEKEYSLKAIALLDDIPTYLKRTLEHIRN